MSHYFLHLFLTGGGFALGLVCGIAQTVWLYEREKRQARRAKEPSVY